MERHRIVNIPLKERELEVLYALSIIESKPLSVIVKEALAQTAKKLLDDPEFPEKVEAHRLKLDKDREQLLSNLGIEDTSKNNPEDGLEELYLK